LPKPEYWPVMPPDQAPKHSVLGQPSPEYDAQTPFTV